MNLSIKSKNWINKITFADFIKIIFALIGLFISYQMNKTNLSIQEINKKADIYFNLYVKSYKVGVVYSLGKDITFHIKDIDFKKNNASIILNHLNYNKMSGGLLLFNKTTIIDDYSFLLIESIKKDSTVNIVINKK